MAYDFPNSPTVGQQYNPSSGPTYVWNGTAWVVLTPGNQFNRTVFTATAGQTTFTMNYVVGAIDVYRNGVKLVNTADFTATNGTSIVLLNAATVGDTIEVISYPMITYSDAVKRTGDTMTGALAVPSLTVNSVPVLAGPAFSAYQNTAQTLSANTYTKLSMNIEEYDTASCYDTTLFRFTPNVAGYYLVQGSFEITTAQSTLLVLIYKNGSVAKSLDYKSGSSNKANGGAYIYLNGTTDYIELYGFSSVNNAVSLSSFSSYFQAALVRAA